MEFDCQKMRLSIRVFGNGSALVAGDVYFGLRLIVNQAGRGGERVENAFKNYLNARRLLSRSGVRCFIASMIKFNFKNRNIYPNAPSRSAAASHSASAAPKRCANEGTGRRRWKDMKYEIH